MICPKCGEEMSRCSKPEWNREQKSYVAVYYWLCYGCGYWVE